MSGHPESDTPHHGSWAYRLLCLIVCSGTQRETFSLFDDGWNTWMDDATFQHLFRAFVFPDFYGRPENDGEQNIQHTDAL